MSMSTNWETLEDGAPEYDAFEDGPNVDGAPLGDAPELPADVAIA